MSIKGSLVVVLSGCGVAGNTRHLASALFSQFAVFPSCYNDEVASVRFHGSDCGIGSVELTAFWSVATPEVIVPRTLIFKNPELESKLRRCCEQVLKEFEFCDLRLLCFVDDESPAQFDEERGPCYAGFHTPVIGSGSLWPPYVERLFFNSMGNFAFDNVIYINGRTSSATQSMVITLAHELQHFMQFANQRKVWKANSLIYELLRSGPETTVNSWDITFEQDAIRVSRKVAEKLLGEQDVMAHAQAQIMTGNNAGYWRFFMRLVRAESFNLLEEAKPWVERYRVDLLRARPGEANLEQQEWWK